MGGHFLYIIMISCWYMIEALMSGRMLTIFDLIEIEQAVAVQILFNFLCLSPYFQSVLKLWLTTVEGFCFSKYR